MTSSPTPLNVEFRGVFFNVISERWSSLVNVHTAESPGPKVMLSPSWVRSFSEPTASITQRMKLAA